MRRHREMGKYMKRVFIIIAVLCVVLGLAGTIADSKETTQMTEEIKSYPVIDVSELSEYKEEKETQEMIVTGITCKGDTIKDTKGMLKGKYFYIHTEAEKYDSEENDWSRADEECYEVVSKKVTTTANEDEKIDLTTVFTYSIPKITTYYPKGKDDISDGALRYEYRALGAKDKMSAIMMVGNGKAEVKPLVGYRKYLYICGDETAVYGHWKAFGEGDSFLFLFLGVLLGAVFGYFAWLCRRSSSMGRVGEAIGDALATRKRRRQEYKEMSAAMKRRYHRLHFLGALLVIAGFAVIFMGYESTGWIIVGTLLLIAGVAAWKMAAPDSYNEGSDTVQMLSFDRPRKIEEFYEAYKNFSTPLGSGYLAEFYTMKQKALVFGPDSRGQFLYFWITQDGNRGYLGYSFLEKTIKKKLNEPLIPVQSDFATNTAEYICYNSDIALLQKYLLKSLEHFAETGQTLELNLPTASGVYTFTEDFKLTGQHFDLCDLEGNQIYEIDGTMPLISFHIYDKSHTEVFKVTKEIGHALPTYRFYYKGEPYGTLEKQFVLVKDKFKMETKEGTLELVEYAGYVGHNFQVTLNGKMLGAIMDDLKLNMQNIVYDNAVIIVYEEQYLPLLAAMAIMVAREIARDHAEWTE